MKKDIRKIYEFVMWQNCNNECSFCFLRYDKNYHSRLLIDSEKIQALDCVINFLKSDEFERGSHILIAGGELFYQRYKEDVYAKFKELTDLIIDYMHKGYIDILYLNSNLLFDDLSDIKTLFLYPLIENNLISHIHFTTSYDRYGRYANKQKEEQFLHNLKSLVEEFKDVPDFPIYVNCILTEPLCNDVISGSFNRREFVKEHYNKIYVNFLPYIPFDKSLEPSDNLIFRTLLYIKNDDEVYFEYYINNFLLDQERTVYEYNKFTHKLDDHTSEINPKCGHLKSFSKFRDGDKCLLCNYKKIKDALL